MTDRGVPPAVRACDGSAHRRILLLMAPTATLALLASGCRASNTINTTSAEDAIAAKLQSLDPEAAPYTVTCPADIPAKRGNTFTCRVTSADGTTINVVNTQTDDEGTFDIAPETVPGQPPSTAPGE